MTTTQRPRTPRRPAPAPGPNPASRGLILVAVGVVLGLILIVKGGGIGFDSTGSDVEIGSGDAAATSTTEPPETSVSTPTTEKPAAEVQVVSANGSSVSGLASKTNTFLAQAGYSNSVATDSLQPATTTTVYYATGLEGNAKAIATLLNVPRRPGPAAGRGRQAGQEPAGDRRGHRDHRPGAADRGRRGHHRVEHPRRLHHGGGRRHVRHLRHRRFVHHGGRQDRQHDHHRTLTRLRTWAPVAPRWSGTS